MKKLFAALLVACTMLSFPGCGETKPVQESAGENGSIPATTVTAADPDTQASETAMVPETKTTEETGEAPTEPLPTEAVPMPTEEPEPEEEEKPAPPETLPAGAHISFSGAPTLGKAEGSTYTNASIHLKVTIPDSYSFVSEPSMLELNEVSNMAELAGKTTIHITADFLDIIRVWAVKLGSTDAGGNTTESAFSYVVDKEISKLVKNGGQVESEPCFVTFTSGDAVANRVVATAGTEVTTHLFLGYQVGDYLVIVTVNDFYGDAVETLLAGIDISGS